MTAANTLKKTTAALFLLSFSVDADSKKE